MEVPMLVALLAFLILSALVGVGLALKIIRWTIAAGIASVSLALLLKQDTNK